MKQFLIGLLLFILGCVPYSPLGFAQTHGPLSPKFDASPIAGTNRFRLEKDYTYVSEGGTEWTVPKGFETSGFTMPAYLADAAGVDTNADLAGSIALYEYYAATRDRPYEDVMSAFEGALQVDNVPTQKAKAVYFAARAFGPRWQAEGSAEVQPSLSVELEASLSRAAIDASMVTGEPPTGSDTSGWLTAAQSLSVEDANQDLVTLFKNGGAFTEAVGFNDLKALIENSRPRVVLDPENGSAEVRLANLAADTNQVARVTSLDTVISRTYADSKFRWFHLNPSSDTVVVFVHGILSNLRDAWLNEDKQAVFWPELIRRDEAFGSPNIALVGYTTSFVSGIFGIEDAANEVNIYLKSRMDGAGKSVMDYKNIVFVTHSLGGVVIRDLLVDNREEFRNKNVGLALYASPSFGAQAAKRLEYFITFLRHKMGKQLETGSAFLSSLDRRFSNVIASQRIPNFVGLEAIEHKFITYGFLGTGEVVVSKNSGGRYFNNVIMIGESDHMSIVKPDSIDAQTHLVLRDFYVSAFTPLLAVAQ